MAAAPPPITPAPPDQFNQQLMQNVHPSGWINPAAAPRYNLVVIGAGTAGLVAAAGAAGLGAKVALVERNLMGGDCLNYGCVPSKTLIRAARTAAEIRDAERMGITTSPIRVDFARVMERVRRLRAELSANDSAERFKRLGVDVFLGDARFTAPDCAEVRGQTLRFARAVIATGARAAVLPIPGLVDIGYLTNETIFSLTALPRRIAVIGAGPVGCELAQALRRFGAEVVLLEVMPQILIREDRDAAERVANALEHDGVHILSDCKILSVAKHGSSEKTLRVEQARAIGSLVVDEIVVGVGRTPNVEGLGLEAAGVAYDVQKGVAVNEYLQTANRRIYAAGDVCTQYRFTHVADAMARIVIRNALFFGRARISALTIPWCTYTDPEVAHVGLHEGDAQARGVAIQTFVQELASVDRAAIDGDTGGFVKIHVSAGTDRIVGATVVASHASEIISELTTAIARKIGLRALAEVIHPYPTRAEAIRKIADAYNRTRLTPFVKRNFERLLRWRLGRR